MVGQAKKIPRRTPSLYSSSCFSRNELKLKVKGQETKCKAKFETYFKDLERHIQPSLGLSFSNYDCTSQKNGRLSQESRLTSLVRTSIDTLNDSEYKIKAMYLNKG